MRGRQRAVYELFVYCVLIKLSLLSNNFKITACSSFSVPSMLNASVHCIFSEIVVYALSTF